MLHRVVQRRNWWPPPFIQYIGGDWKIMFQCDGAYVLSHFSFIELAQDGEAQWHRCCRPSTLQYKVSLCTIIKNSRTLYITGTEFLLRHSLLYYIPLINHIGANTVVFTVTFHCGFLKNIILLVNDEVGYQGICLLHQKYKSNSWCYLNWFIFVSIVLATTTKMVRSGNKESSSSRTF